MSTLRRLRGSQRYPKAQFQLEITDALLDFSPGFQPHAIYVSVTRHGKEYLSQSVKWEASLKSPQSGLCLWHPPFQCVIEISIPPESALKSGGGSGSGPEDIHKDAFVSLYNTVPGKKGKVKLLAKSRIDLFEYRDQVDKSIFKMKLLPETKKVKKSTINVSILNGTKLQMQRKAQEDLDTVMGHVGVQSKGMASRKSLDLASDGAHSLSKSLHSLDPLENLSTSSPAQESSNVSDISAPFVLSAGSRKSVDLNLKDLQKALPKIEQDSAAVTKAQSMEGNLDKNPVTPSANETVLLGPSPFVRAYTPSAATKNLNLSPPPTQKTTASMEDIFDSVTDKILDSPVHHSKPLFSAKPTPLQQNDTPSMGRISSRFSENDKDILQWSKKALKKYPQVKVTNMSSSWRNGMAYCALIHAKYPELISFKKLNGQNAEDNTKLAQKAAELLNVSSPEDLHSASKDANAKFLQDLKNALENPRKLSEEELKQWKKTQEQLEKHKLRPESSIISLPPQLEAASNRDSVSILNTLEALSISSSSHNSSKQNSQTPEPSDDQVKLAEDSKHPQVAASSPEKPQKTEVSSTSSPAPNPSHQQFVSNSSPQQALPLPQPANTPNRKRVQEMILNAHRSLSIQEDDVEAMKNEPLSKIQEELRLLNVQAEHFASEQNRLQNLLRDSDEPSALESLILVVNEKNSLVRRQMQLNILEKETMIKMKQEKIQDELQQIADIAEDRKTESVRNREQELIEEHLKLVNEKNELVYHLDSQEQAIVEDEVIKESLRTGKIPLDLKNDECVLQ